MVDDCLAKRPHVIDEKQVDPKRAMPRVRVCSLSVNQTRYNADVDSE